MKNALLARAGFCSDFVLALYRGLRRRYQSRRETFAEARNTTEDFLQPPRAPSSGQAQLPSLLCPLIRAVIALEVSIGGFAFPYGGFGFRCL